MLEQSKMDSPEKLGMLMARKGLSQRLSKVETSAGVLNTKQDENS